MQVVQVGSCTALSPALSWCFCYETLRRAGASQPTGSRMSKGLPLTYFLHRCVQREEALSEELLHHLFIVCLDFRHHVTRNKAKPSAGFPAVESISIFITVNLEPWEEVKALGWAGSEIHQLYSR